MSFNTGNPIGSISEEDCYDNMANLDQAMNSTEPTWRDRFNVEKPTIDAALKSAGFMPAGFDFVTGGTLQPGDRNKAVYNPAPNGDNNWYRWNGVFPKEIAANSQPNPKNENNWVLAHFRIGIVEKEALRRTYLEAGYNLVNGSFEQGGTLVNSNDVLLQERTGKAFSGPAGEVAAGTNPASGGFVARDTEALRYQLATTSGYSLLGEFDSVASLKAFSKYGTTPNGARVSVKSYYAGTGLGGGFFRWDAASTDADDGGYTINPTGNAGAGRWKREAFAAVAARTVCPLEFGAKINDSTFDSAPMINKAISYLNPYLDKDYDSQFGGDVISPAGVFYINDTIYGAPNVRLLGTGASPGFRFSRAGCACIAAMPTMDPLKIMFDTAPWLKDNTARYTNTNEMVYGRTESDGYYGSTLENLVFIGQADTQCAVRIWRVPTSRLNRVSVYGCKVSYWLNGSWDISLRDCFAFGAKYATMLVYQCTNIKVFGGYFTGNQSQLWSMGTPQWFHRAEGASNKPNIAYVTTFMYASNSYDVNTYAATIEYYNRPWALFFCGNVSQFGGYSESLGTPVSETGHRVYVHCVASEFFNNGVYFNHDIMDAVVQSGNIIDANRDYTPSERSKVEFINPRMVTKFVNINKDLGYGSYNILIDCQHYITESLSTTLAALRSYSAQFRNLLDQYTMRTPTIVPNGTISFSFTINNLVAQGDYELRFILRNTETTVHQDLRFNMLIGTSVSVSGYEARSRVGTATFSAPTVTFDGANTATITFQGNSGYYSFYRVKCLPRETQNIFTF